MIASAQKVGHHVKHTMLSEVTLPCRNFVMVGAISKEEFNKELSITIPYSLIMGIVRIAEAEREVR